MDELSTFVKGRPRNVAPEVALFDGYRFEEVGRKSPSREVGIGLIRRNAPGRKKANDHVAGDECSDAQPKGKTYRDIKRYDGVLTYPMAGPAEDPDGHVSSPPRLGPR